MSNSRLTLRLLALSIYWLVSAAVLWRLLLSVEPPSTSRQHATEPRMPGDAPPVIRKLFRHHPPAGAAAVANAAEFNIDDSGNPLRDLSENGSAHDEAALELAGFQLPKLPPHRGSNYSTMAIATALAHGGFFNLRRRRRLAETLADSPEALTRRANSRLLDFHFELAASTRLCTSRETIFVAVMTTPGAADRRSAARRTWLSQASNAGARVAFFVARGVNASAAIRRQLELESQRFGDIVLVPDFAETYTHLTLKVLAALDFACRMCPMARMFAKVDDDSVLNLPALRSKWLDRYERQFPSLEYALGYRYETPTVKRQGRWQVSQADYPLEKFPSYMFGGAYALRVDACRLTAAARYFPVPPIEDAFVTGILPAALGIRQAADNSGFACQFFNHAGSLNPAAFSSGLVMSGTDLTPRRMLGFWRRLLKVGDRQRAAGNISESVRLNISRHA